MYGQTTTFTFAWFRNGSNFLLRTGKSNEEGSFYIFMSSIMFTAFFVEAYLNHLGEDLHGDEWETVRDGNKKSKKVRWSVKRKLEKLLEKVWVDCPWKEDERPYLTFLTMFELRNEVAHGRTQVINTPTVPKSGEKGDPFDRLLKPKWLTLIDQNTAEMYLEDAIRMVEDLHKAAGKDPGDLHAMSEGFINGLAREWETIYDPEEDGNGELFPGP